LPILFVAIQLIISEPTCAPFSMNSLLLMAKLYTTSAFHKVV